MKAFLSALMVFGFSQMATANIEGLLGEYVATDLGCATPRGGGYALTVDMAIDDFEQARDSATRTLEVYVKVQREVVIECRVWYTGPISFVEGGYYGSLARTQDNGGRGYDCGALNDRQANGIVSAFVDPYFIETDVITPLSVEAVKEGVMTLQQAVAPPQEIRGCGMAYPVFTFQKQ